ncbi:phosphotransferase enzyme family protein [Limisphaera sp. VF-2]|jgi:Ser/Thr protein kinase RdoA (MazF antagonist)|uniref:phosphotransferase enzyme family protein n=1 Tax=Limisphaera sp. VF-2 TaxID=3400418 RepID=UPI001755492F
MPVYEEQQLQEISRQFQIYGEILHAETCKIGHINETYSATYDQGGTRVRYVHQKINRHVFKDPPAVMENLERVCRHLRQKLEARGVSQITRRCLTIVPARDGRPYYVDRNGDYWRTFLFIEGVQTFEAVQSPGQAFEAGRAFGEFQQLLVDLPGPRLHETIPDFHNTRKRFAAFLEAVEKDPANRAREARAEIEFALRRESITGVILDAMARGRIPERITHNDTKFNNVLMDVATGEAMCVVDLDTVMPGCALYDFGDMVRTTTSPTLEDERDLSKVRMQLPVFEKLVAGYLSAAGAFLTPAERRLLPFAGKLITFETGLRFLTDFLTGDMYFRIHRPGHNLDRCRTQFKLVESIEQQEEAMQRIVDRWDGGPTRRRPRQLRVGRRSVAGHSTAES